MRQNILNRRRVVALLRRAQGSSVVRLLAYDNITDAIDAAERVLAEMAIPRKHHDGTRIIFEPSRTHQNSDPAEGTYAKIIRYNLGWAIVTESISRVRCVIRNRASMEPGHLVTLVLSDKARENNPTTRNQIIPL